MPVRGALFWSVFVLASQASQAPRPPAATGLIVGRVVDGSSGRPIPAAIVTLDGAAAASPGSSAPRALTNSSGQFVFRRLPKGTFFLSATRVGYVDGAYGRRRPGGTSASLQLGDGERVSDVSIRMWKHASISGAVTDESGEPLVRVMLRAFQRRYVAGRKRLVQNGNAFTDDRGVYRFANLAPGEYLIGFVPREVSMPAATAEMTRTMSGSDPKMLDILRERSVLGVSFPPPGNPNAVQIGNMVRASDPTSPVPPAAGDEKSVFVYPAQFFPGVATAARAAAIALESGQQRENVDFTLRPTRAVRISGTVIGAEGPVPNVALRLVAAGEDVPAELDVAATMAGPDGAFSFLGVVPGRYTIRVLRVPRFNVAAPTTTTQMQVGSSIMISSSGPSNGPRPVPDDPTLFADVPVAVANVDVSDVIVALQRGARLSGRVEFDGMRERPDAASLTRIPVMAERADNMNPGNAFQSIPPGRVDESGTFKTYGLPPGRYIVRLGSAPVGWYLKSVVSEGRDVSDTPMDLRAADVANVVITFTDRPTRLTGMVRTPEGNPDRDALVIVFPVENSGWSDFGLNPRRMRSVRPSKDGTYTLTGMPSGDYYVTAIREDSIGQWQDPQLLEELARTAAHVRLMDGETRTQDVKTGGGA